MRRAGSLASIVALCALSALALADAITGWTFLPAYLVACLIAVGLADVVMLARAGRASAISVAVAGIATACFAIHLACVLVVGFEARNWERLAPRKAERARDQVAAIFDGYLADLDRQARAMAGRSEVQAALRSDNPLAAFREAGRLAPDLKRRYGTCGLVLRDRDGRAIAWSGDLPNYPADQYPEDRPQGPPAEGVSFGRSTVYYWLEAHAGAGGSGEGGGGAGWVSAYRAIDARYPGILPGRLSRTLSESLTRRVGHQVELDLMGEGPTGAESDRRLSGPGAGAVTGDLRLPGGREVGTVTVRERSLDEERALLTGRWLFVVALLLVVLVGTSAVTLSRHALGRRLARVRPRSVLAFLCIVWAARLAAALLRDPLRLDGLRAFASLDYATQVPAGLLRSPADLALTSAAALLGAAIVAVAVVRRLRSGRPSDTAGPAGFLAAALLAAAACAVAVAGDLGIRRILADTSVNPFAIPPLDISAAGLSLKTGLLFLTATGVLVSASLVAAAADRFRRSLAEAGRRSAWSGSLVLAGLVLFGSAAAAAVLWAGPVLMIAACVSFAAGTALVVAVARRQAPGIAGIAVGLALAASAVQYPFALETLYAGRRDVVESRAARVAAGSDQWKMSLLDEAVSQVGEDRQVRAALGQPAGRLDSEALRLWARSILSGARVPCGVYLVDRNDLEVGRFSLEDRGESDFESALRAARFEGGPVTLVSRGNLGGKEADLYVGVVPLVEDGVYLGSVVISVPYSYGDLETLAGLKPTFFEAAGADSRRGVEFGGGYSASLISGGKVAATTAKDLEVGSDFGAGGAPRWVERRTASGTWVAYLVPLARAGDALALGFRRLTLSERAVYLMAVVLANVVAAVIVILAAGLVRAVRLPVRWARGRPAARPRWSFATKLALAFLLIAIVPTVILGTASSGFVRARLREVMEARAEESLQLAKLALERQVGGEAARLARNPILMDELRDEPSILSVLVGSEFDASVVDSSGLVLASIGDAALPDEVLRSVVGEGRTYNSFSAAGGLTAKAATPIRDVIFPGRVTGCSYVTRTIDGALARRLAADLATDVTFYAGSRVAASSKQDLFVAEIVNQTVSADAYADCLLRGREIDFTWERIGDVEVVTGYSPLRGFDGNPVGAISVPLVFRKDDVGRRMEWTSMALSYLMAMVIAAIFALGLVLARRISGPIRELTRGTLRVISGDLGFTVPKHGDDEIGDLVTSFNRMTDALEKSRNSLTERKRYIETIISNVGAGIISTDAGGRIDTINGAAEEALGVRGRNARGKEARALLRRIGAAPLVEVLEAVGPGGEVVRREIVLARVGGAQQTLRVVASAVKGPGHRLMGRVVVFEDVTELIRSKKLVAWSEMARQVAHEIKNPLTPMKLSAQQILQAHRDRAGDFDGILEQGLATIVDEIEALRRIAVEFSQFSRMPERRLIPTDINEVAAESLAHYQRTVGGSVEIASELDPDLPGLVFDRDEMKRVFVNIIENALQAMPSGGRLTVRSTRSGGAAGGADRERGTGGGGEADSGYRVSATSRPVYADRLRSYVEVSFTDTGSGISAENARRLFEPNFSTKTQGTGLGLAISKGTLDAYGGEILIESGEGSGTRVSVRLPVEEAPTQRHRPRRRGSRRRRRPRRG